MRNHQLFFEKFEQISDANEQKAFMRGYMLRLTPKQLQAFFSENAKNGLAAINKLNLGDSESKDISSLMLDNLSKICKELKKSATQMA